MLSETGRVGHPARYLDAIVEVQLARAAVVVEAVGEVDVLLEFQQRYAAADCVDGAGRHEEQVAAANWFPIHQVLDRSIERRRPELVLPDVAPQAQRDGGAWFGVENVPAFALAAGEAAGPRIRIVGVDLNRQTFAGEQIFEEQGQFAAAREPDFPNPFA